MLDSMFGGGVSADLVNESNKAHAVNAVAIMDILISKGICTQEDINVALVKATALIDQAWAEKREAAEREFDEKHPGLRDMFKRLWGDKVENSAP